MTHYLQGIVNENFSLEIVEARKQLDVVKDKEKTVNQEFSMSTKNSLYRKTIFQK